MAFTSGHDDDVISDINITPLVDVMLVLLVVFIITAPMLNNAIPLNLPQTQATAPLDEPKPVAVSLDAKGQAFLDLDPVASGNLGIALQALKARDATITLTLRADGATPYARVAQVLAEIEQAGITRLAIITQSP